MKKKILIAMGGAAVLGLSLLGNGATNAGATTISITNPSFEAPAQADGGGSFGDPTGWTSINFVSAGVQNPFGGPTPGGYAFINASDNSVTFGSMTPIGGDQQQVLYINATDASGASSMKQTLTGVSLLPDFTYTLKVAIGNENLISDGFKIELFAGATSLGSFSGNSSTFASANLFADATVIYTAPSSGLPSGDLSILLQNTHSVVSGTGQTIFDNVRLDMAVPEPSSVALLGLGGILVWLRRKKTSFTM